MINYKKFIKSKYVRLKILDLLQFISDEKMIKIQYKMKIGNKLNLSNPIRYSEKLQWYKLNYYNPMMRVCADKYTVRDYVKSKGLEDILNEIYGVFNKAEDIDFNKLPKEFVIKTTNGAGGDNVIICKNKNELDKKYTIKLLNSWIKKKKKDYGREGVYSNSEAKIIVERLLPRNNNNDLPDYKFFCFQGKVYCLYTMIDYVDNHKNGKLGFYDNEFKRMPFNRLDFQPINKSVEKPKNFEKMIEISEILSKDFPHVRVDLYNIDGNIVFGELTFFTASGYMKFNPDEFDYILGEKFILPEKNKF